MAASRIAGVIVLLMVIAGLLGYRVYQDKPEATNNLAVSSGKARAANPENQQQLGQALALLQTGDVVLRTGADMTSYMFAQLNPSDKTYAHCGIVSVEGGMPWVYHSIGGADNPHQTLMREPARHWLSPERVLNFGAVRFQLDSAARKTIAIVARKYYLQHRSFDLDFDLRTDDKLYCAEFVYKAISEAVHQKDFFNITRRMGYAYVSVDNIFLHKQAQFICRNHYK